MRRELPPPQLEAYRALMPGFLERMAAPHIGPSAEGGTVLLQHKPAEYPGQDPESRWVIGTPQSREATDYAANVAQRGYIPARDALEARAGTVEKIEAAGRHLRAGGNVAIVTRHDNLTDIAYGLKGGKDLLYGRGYEPRITAIIVGEMLSRIGHTFTFEGKPQEVPSIGTLQLLCDIIYKSHPRTDSTDAAIDELPKEQAEIMRAGMAFDNDEMLVALEEQLERGGVLLGLAPTGTTQAEVAESGGLKLASLKSGTVDIMKRTDMRILCTLLEFGKAPFAYILGDLMAIENAKEAEAAMAMLAQAETKDITDTGDAELFRRFGGIALG